MCNPLHSGYTGPGKQVLWQTVKTGEMLHKAAFHLGDCPHIVKIKTIFRHRNASF